MSDLQDLLQRCQNGELSAFDRLFRIYEGKVFRLAMSILRDKLDAEDAVQDAFLRVFLKLDGYRGESAFDTWLTAVVVNVCRDKIRRKRMRQFLSLDWLKFEPIATLPEFNEMIDLHQQSGDLWNLVGQLKDRLRIPVILVYQEGMPVKEAALVLGLPYSTVYSQLKEAHKQLQHMHSAKGPLEAGQMGEEGC